MGYRKFEHEKPKDTNERIEAIYEELCIARDSDTYSLSTLKDYVNEVLKLLRKVEMGPKDKEHAEESSLSIAIGLLAFLSFILLTIGWGKSPNIDLINDLRFPISLWGIAFAAVFIGVSIERSPLCKRLWSFGFTKLVVSLALSALFVFCSGKASSLINSVFGVDASAFPLTRAYLTGLIAFQYSTPLLIIVAIFATFHALVVIAHIKSETQDFYGTPWLSFAFLIFSIVVMCFSWQWMRKYFSEPELPKKTYKLARILDFNNRNSCKDLPDGLNVVFLGSNSSRVLVDPNHVEVNTIESFLGNSGDNDITVPKEFFVLPCEPGKTVQSSE